MHYKRFRFILSIAAMLALIAGTLPMAFSTAMENAAISRITCPPLDDALAQNVSYMKALPAQCRGLAQQKDTAQPMPFARSLLLATGGPDDFGYTYDDTVPFSWISATSDSGVLGDEGGSGPFFDIGFSFPFHGSSFTQLSFSTNGFITFDLASECCYWSSAPIPSAALPNNFIAAFWDDLLVGPPFNSGAIYYEKGGVAPDRYLVLEWRNVTTYAGSDPFSFEAILYENGNILVQHQSLPASYFASVGIENASGDDGLQYHAGSSGLTAPKAILFSYPSGPIARISVSPLVSGMFAASSGNTNFPITIANPGSAGTDTYDLSSTSTWAVDLYQAGCVMPLTDTDADTVIDTGPIAQSAAVTVCVSFSPPVGAGIGDSNSGVLSVTSSIDTSRTRDATFSMVVPTSFVQVFEEYTNAAMAFQVNGPGASTTHHVTSDFYFANGLSVMRMPDGRYIYAWRKPDGNFQDAHSNIEFSLLNLDGSFDVPVTQLTNNFGTGQTYDYDPALAIAPNGNIGVVWRRWIVDNNTNLFNYNIFFAMLSENGTVLYPPTNVTDNMLWGRFDNLDVPNFFNPSIAATGDNLFFLSWTDYRTDGLSTFNNDVWYSIRNHDGSNRQPPLAFTHDGSGINPLLHPMAGNDVMLTWNQGLELQYAVFNSSGGFSYLPGPLGGTSYFGADAVRLPDGNVAVAWTTTGPEVGYVVLDAAYNLIAGPVFAANPAAAYNRDLSVTYDEANRIVMIWVNDEGERATRMFYALADETGAFLNAPTLVRSSTPGLLASINGQGNAPIITDTSVLEVMIDIRPGSATNVINLRSTGVIPVAILSEPGFDASTMVDRASLRFGRTGDETSLQSCNMKAAQDVNGDGLYDLVCYFRIQAAGFSLGDTVGLLTGMTVGDIPLAGSDTVTVRSK